MKFQLRSVLRDGGLRLRPVALLRDWLAVQDCWLCRQASHGRLLCACCRRDLPRGPPASDLPRLARQAGLDALCVRHDYRFPLDVLVQAYKYRGEQVLAPVLADLLPDPPPAAPGRPWTLLAVPSSDLRLRERGFDHLHPLARRYDGRHELTMTHGRRRDEAGHQVGLGRLARQRLLADAFLLPQAPPAVLLLDDVLTTGSTLAALAHACRRGGAQRVAAVVLARTPAPDELRPQ